MAKYFLETSALVKRYKPERGSGFIDGLFASGHDLYYLNLSLVEVQKMFIRLWKYPQHHEGDVRIQEQEYLSLETSLANDLLQMQRIELTEEMITRTREVLNHSWLKSALDTLFLAAYLVTKDQYPDIIFVSSDIGSNLVPVAKGMVGDQFVIIPEETP